MTALRLTSPDATRGWQARLRLGFEAARGRTVLVHRRHEGPLLVQSPFYPEGAVCHVYVLHPPGGVVGGDQLSLQATLGEGTHALITTPAATKLYRSAGREAWLHQSLHLGHGATLEWLPQESLAFAGTEARIQTRVNVRESSRFIGWDAVCLGRPASGERFTYGTVRQDLELWCDGRPVLIERNRLDAGSPLMDAAWGLSGASALATLLVYPSEQHLLSAARKLLHEFIDGRAAATEVDGLLVCRAVASSMLPLRKLLAALWATLRPRALQLEPCPPRIWTT